MEVVLTAQQQATRRYYARNRRVVIERAVSRNRLVRAGCSPEEYQALLEKQGGHCAICDKKPVASLHVDHDHLTGRVRELLCKNCNTLIGQAYDLPRILRAAADYLEKHGG